MQHPKIFILASNEHSDSLPPWRVKRANLHCIDSIAFPPTFFLGGHVLEYSLGTAAAAAVEWSTTKVVISNDTRRDWKMTRVDLGSMILSV